MDKKWTMAEFQEAWERLLEFDCSSEESEQALQENYVDFKNALKHYKWDSPDEFIEVMFHDAALNGHNIYLKERSK